MRLGAGTMPEGRGESPRGNAEAASAGGGVGGGATVAAEAALAEAEAAGASVDGGGAPGVTAHQSPAATNSAPPRAGSHIGVFGSSSAGAEAEACGSLMARTFYHTWAVPTPPHVGPATARALQPGSAMIVSVKHPLLLSVALVCVATPALAQPPLPPLPGSGGEAAQPASAAAPTPQQLYEHVRRGLVVLERNGLPVAIGTVLGTDGRILTALSGLGGSDSADVLYADGTTVHAKVGQSDRGTDLALLVPQTGASAARWADGLAASAVDPATSPLRAMVPTRGARLAPAEADVKGKADAHGHDGQPLQQMLDIAVKGPLFAGAPLLDSSGDVVAVLVRACKGATTGATATNAASSDPWAAWGSAPQATAKAAACSPVVVGAPVAAIRSFLTSAATAAPAAVAPAPWLGIRGEPQAQGSVHGVQVMAVAPQSPAEAAGLKPSADVIAAVDGESVDTPAKLSEAIGKHAVGDTVKLLVFGQGKFREVSVALRAAP